MALTLTDRTLQVLKRVNILPQYVLEIDGVSTVYTATLISAVIKIGDTGLTIGNDWQIGGFAQLADQSDTISLSIGTTEISQQLNPDKGAISSISSMKVSLVDYNDGATALITPGSVVTDMLARRCKVYIGFDGTSYPEDYSIVFRGIIDDIVSEQGAISLNIAHPDQKKRNTIYELASTSLDGAITDSDTTITVLDTDQFLVGITGPDGAVDSSFTGYIKIDDEIIKYTGKTSTTFTGCLRGQLNTTAASHENEADVNSFYRLTGNGVELALKLMLSGWGGAFEEEVEVTSFNQLTPALNVPNAMYFQGVNLKTKYGLHEGDYITTTGASNGANNVTLKQIETIEILDSGTYIVIDGVTFVDESTTSAVVDFRSQYDTLPDGLMMHGDEVDVDGHILWYRRYLSSFSLDFYLKDTIEGKEFIEKEIFLPMGGYSLPRKARASMGYHSGPIPTETIAIIDETNVTNAKNLALRRTMGKNFYNTIIYKFDEDSLEEKFLTGWVETDTDSKDRIPIGNKSLVIESRGMRKSLQGASNANLVATRLLNRYKFAAEFIDNVKVKFSTGYGIEVGDIVLFDGSSLNISDTINGVRGAPPKFYEVINKKMNLKTGEVSISLVNTNFSTNNRYGLISPASKIQSGSSNTVFTIKESYSGLYGTNEYRKWEKYVGCSVTVRSSDFSTSGTAVLESVVGNTITVASSLGFTPSADYVMELSHYNNQTETIKLIYTFMTDAATFDDGEDRYRMI